MRYKRICLVFFLACLSTACAGTRPYTESCPEELSRGWTELDLARTNGVDGTLSYAKAVALLTSAKAMQLAENYERCYRLASDARVQIKNSQN